MIGSASWKCPRCNKYNAPWLPQCFCKELETILPKVESTPVNQDIVQTEKKTEESPIASESLCAGCGTSHSIYDPCARS